MHVQTSSYMILSFVWICLYLLTYKSLCFFTVHRNTSITRHQFLVKNDMHLNTKTYDGVAWLKITKKMIYLYFPVVFVFLVTDEQIQWLSTKCCSFIFSKWCFNYSSVCEDLVQYLWFWLMKTCYNTLTVRNFLCMIGVLTNHEKLHATWSRWLYQLRWIIKGNQNCEMDGKMLLMLAKVVVNTKIVVVNDF